MGWRRRGVNREAVHSTQRKPGKLDSGRGAFCSSRQPRFSSLRLSLRSLRLCVEVVFPPGERLAEGAPVFCQVLGRLGAAQDNAFEALLQDETEGARLAEWAIFVQHAPHAERPVPGDRKSV